MYVHEGVGLFVLCDTFRVELLFFIPNKHDSQSLRPPNPLLYMSISALRTE